MQFPFPNECWAVRSLSSESQRLCVFSAILLLSAPLGAWAEDPLVEDLAPLLQWVRQRDRTLDPAVEEALQKGLVQLSSGDYLAAATRLEEAILLAPCDPRLHLARCVARMATGDVLESAAALRASLASGPAWGQVRIRLRRWFLTGEDHQRALEGVRRWAARADSIPEVLLLSAFCELSSGRAEEARAQLKTLLGREEGVEGCARRLLRSAGGGRTSLPTRYPSHRDEQTGEFSDPLVRGYDKFRQGRYSESAQAFAEARLSDPDDPAVAVEFCHALFALGRYCLAGQLLRRAVRRDPSLLDQRLDRHRIYADPTDFDHQQTTLGDWLEENPRRPDALFLFGYNEYYSGRLAEAKVVFDALAGETGADLVVAAFRRKIEERMAAGEGGEEPEPVPDVPLRLRTETPPAGLDLAGRAGWHFGRGDHESAVALRRRLVEAGKDVAENRRWAARSALALGHFAKAGSTLRKALEVTENWREFRFLVSQGFDGPGVVEGHVKRLAQHVERFPDDRDASFLLGVIRHEERDYRRARELFVTNVHLDLGDTASTWYLERIRAAFARSY